MTEDANKSVAELLREEIAAQAATIAEQVREIERLTTDNKMPTDHLDDCVQEKISELDAEGEAFDKECWNVLRSVCESRPGFDWSDFNDHMTADDAAQFLYEELREADRRAEAAESALATATARIEKLEAALREVDECFEAALIEGWIDALANGDIEIIRDLFTRRIEYARHAAIAALEDKP